ncbi:MAG: hypothetical protein NTW19_15600 [Planctomycetota bacterium]|nr:hypothetical protein [Planctomycetota bacterium]
MKHPGPFVRAAILLSAWLSLAAAAFAAPVQTFSLKEYLGNSWTNEVVTYRLDAAAQGPESGYHVLDDAGHDVPFQFIAGADGSRSVAMLVDLPAFTARTFRLESGPIPQTVKPQVLPPADLKVETEMNLLRVTNGLTGIEIPTAAGAFADGPFLRMRLRSGQWIGGSRLGAKTAIESYEARVTASGPVLVEVECLYHFAGGKSWRITYRLVAREPAIVIRESCALTDGSVWQLLVSPGFKPTHSLARDQYKQRVEKVRYGGGASLVLTAWPVWWSPSNVGFLGLCRMAEGSAIARIAGKNTAVAAPRGDEPLMDLKPGEKQASDLGPDVLDAIKQDEKKASKTVELADDFLAAAAGQGELWANPGDDGQSKNIPLMSNPASELFFACPLAGPGRLWMLAALTLQENLVGDEELPAAQRMMVKHCETPLDQVKGMTLEWESTSPNDYPRLISRRSALAGRPEIREFQELRAKSQPPPAKGAKVPDGLRARKLLDPALRIFLGSPDQPAQSMHTVHRCERTMNTAVAADMILGSDVLAEGELTAALGMQAVQAKVPTLTPQDIFTPGDIRYARAQIAFLAYKFASPGYYSLERNYRANPNMTSARYCTMAILASLVPDHPLAKQWAKGGLDEVERELKEWTGPNGGWLEAPHYQTVAMSSILLLGFAAHNAGFADFLDDPRLARSMRYLARISTPPDPRFNGLRHFPPVGNTYQFETTGLFGTLAQVYRKSNPQLADEMLWTWLQQGKSRSGSIGEGMHDATLFPPTTSATNAATPAPGAPAWGSEHFPGSGAVMRSGFPTERETYLYLLHGGFAEHYDDDRGSFELWGKGRPLCLDWGYNSRMPAWLHNRVEAGGWGDITRFKSFEPADYLRTDTQGWERQLLFVKDADPLAGNYYVIRDTIAQPAANWWLWLYTETSPALADGVIRVAGEHDVNLDIWLGPGLVEKLKKCPFKVRAPAPEKPPESVSVESLGDVLKGPANKADALLGDAVKESAAAAAKKPEGTWVETRTETVKCFDLRNQKWEPLTQEGLMVPVTKDEPVFAVLYPRLKTQKPATFAPLAGGRGVKVTHAAGTDYVFLSAKPIEFQEGDVSFKGCAGAIRVRGAKVDLTLGEAGEIALGARKLTATEAATKAFNGP